MNTDKEDIEIRQLFDHLREVDGLQVPAFRAVLGAAECARGERSWLYRHRLALASIVLAVLLTPLLVWILVEPAAPVLQLASTEIVEWEAPTDFLLTTEDDAFLTTVPGIDLDGSWWAAESWDEE